MDWLLIADDCQARIEEWEDCASILVNSVGGGKVRRLGVSRVLESLGSAGFSIRSVGYHPRDKPFQALPPLPPPEQLRERSDEITGDIFRALGRIEGGHYGSRFRIVLDGVDVPAASQWLERLASDEEDSVSSAPAFRPLKEAVPEIHAALAAAGWVYEPWQIAAYVTALRTKPFVILGGVSGTGKSELPGLMSEVVGGAPRTRISVRPDWTDSSDLLGYRDLQRRFCPGDLALAAKAASQDPERLHVCVVDEMNIARVEHYFAEVLSAIEDRGDAEGGSGRLLSEHLSEGDPEWAELRLPRNMAIVGTVNMDESTFGFSKKVLDRAFTIELSSVDFRRWRSTTTAVEPVPVQLSDLTRAHRRLSDLSNAPDGLSARVDAIIRDLSEVNDILAPAQLHLGYRSRDEIVLFVLNAEEISPAFCTTDGTAVDPLDLALMMKVLPRIAGGSRTVKTALAGLLCWTGSQSARTEEAASKIKDEWIKAGRPAAFVGMRFPRSAARLSLMWERMVEEGFTSFWI